MLEKAFQYNMEKGEWVQCTDANLAEKDIEKLSYALIIKNDEYNKNGVYVRCLMHREDEKNLSCVLSYGQSYMGSAGNGGTSGESS